MSLFLSVGGVPNAQCGKPETLQLRSTSGYLASAMTYRTNLGSVRCPWTIIALPGQRINLTLLTFDLPAMHDVTSSECEVYAVIRERPKGSEVTVCKGTSREQAIFVSTSNKIEIQLMAKLRNADFNNFVIKYEGRFIKSVTVTLMSEKLSVFHNPVVFFLNHESVERVLCQC